MRSGIGDHLVRAIDRERGLRISTVVATGVVAEAMVRHRLSPVATLALGRALSSGLLLATLTKGPERVTLQLQSDGPIGSLTVDATDTGDVRGYVREPQVNADPHTKRGRLVDAVGRNGVVNVTRDVGLRDLYQGQTSIVTGEIDEDVEAYLTSSEQVPSALGCEVVLGANGEVIAAGGILVQALPGSDETHVRPLQHALRTGELFAILESGETSAEAIARRMMPSSHIDVIGELRTVRFQCRCSPERIVSMLHIMPLTELDELIAEAKPVQITCNFCNAEYSVEPAEIVKVREDVAGERAKN